MTSYMMGDHKPKGYYSTIAEFGKSFDGNRIMTKEEREKAIGELSRKLKGSNGEECGND